MDAGTLMNLLTRAMHDTEALQGRSIQHSPPSMQYAHKHAETHNQFISSVKMLIRKHVTGNSSHAKGRNVISG